jgi:anti-sigma B factor antagonist
MSEHIKEICSSGNITILKLAKSITLNNLNEVQKEFSDATKNKDIKHILFDLKEVSQADSSGIAGLVDLLRYMKNHQNNGKVGLINLSQHMKSLLAVSKVESIFKVYSSLDDAQKDLGQT